VQFSTARIYVNVLLTLGNAPVTGPLIEKKHTQKQVVELRPKI